jgi:glucosamine-6-phosphate deaminase
MQLERLPDAQAVAARAADLVAETVRAKPESVLLLPAGRTPVLLYAELVRRARSRTLDLARTRLFQLDELCGVGPADARGFQAFFRQHLVQPLGLASCFRGIDGSAREPAAEIERHRRALAACGPADLVLLGLGQNGHVAFNEPGSELADAARVVALGATTLAGLAHQFPNDCPRRGLTLGMAEIAEGARIVMLVTGATKTEMLAHVLGGRATSERPATLLARHPRFVVLADEEALRHSDSKRAAGVKGSSPS